MSIAGAVNRHESLEALSRAPFAPMALGISDEGVSR